MNSAQAVDAFMIRLVSRAYKGPIAGIRQLLEEGPIEPYPSKDRADINNWYQKADQNDQMMIMKTIEQTAFSVLFACLVVLDNVSGNALDGETSDFGLFIQRYENLQAYEANSVSESVQINSTMDLHDLLDEYVRRGMHEKDQ